eukprot:TRINITY_DN19810_c0_g1_i1.p1 TRINITY_DN19810_c0_g1~~TRINITY_DN19810_c0_g1_i1.p1  ORF type:complete len:111 (+),score=5.74 TRINITY_DN19810_c0_g1_i1:3-335(+)
MHCGPLVAGVIGRLKLCYDLWGDTVNTASRMESHGVPGRTQVSAAAFCLLRQRRPDEFQHRGRIDIRGKGTMDAYLHLAEALKRSQASPATLSSTVASASGLASMFAEDE